MHNFAKSGRVSESSDFASNLSTEILPIPSILNESSISELMTREKDEERKKSNMIRQSIYGIANPTSQ